MGALKQTIKAALLRGARIVGGPFAAPPGALVLTYHSVGPQHLPYTISFELFRAQMELLFEQGRTFYTVAELGAAMARGRVPTDGVCVTFDDAFVNAVEALHWLVDRGGKATLFAVTGESGYNHWDAADPSIPRLERMSVEQLRLLRDAGVEIGSHTVSHRPLPDLAASELHRELSGSRRSLQDQLQVEVHSLAYPYGAYDRRVTGAAAAAGYRWACTMQYAYLTARDRPLLIPRMEPDTVEELADLALGTSHLFYRAMGVVHRTRNQLMLQQPRLRRQRDG
jgi:peptidoglycan/xylan/chitin deacetylase (PgdA/CDA1 family)